MTGDEQGTSGATTDRWAAPPVASAWRKSTVSNPSGNCVELAVLTDGGIVVRNSRSPGGPHITYTRAGIAAFVQGVRAGEFDDLLT